MKKLKRLDTIEDVFALPCGTLAYLTDKAHDEGLLDSEPVLVARKEVAPNPITFIDSTGTFHCYAAYTGEYGKDWWVEVEKGFTVETPHGVLHAYDKKNSEYPGVMVDLLIPGDDIPIGLAMTEYVDAHTEGTYDFMPGQAMKMWDQFNEIPNKRIAIDPETSDLYVTGGLVTRAWPDEVHSEEEHKRVFHYGYQHGHTVLTQTKQLKFLTP